MFSGGSPKELRRLSLLEELRIDAPDYCAPAPRGLLPALYIDRAMQHCNLHIARCSVASV